MKKCMEDTTKLKDCCDLPLKDDESDDTCKEHLEGIEEMDGKEKGQAFTCYAECKAEDKGLLDDEGNLNMEAIKKDTEEDLKKNGAEDLNDLAMESIDYCKKQCKSRSILIFPWLAYTFCVYDSDA